MTMTPKELFDLVSTLLQTGLEIVLIFVELFTGLSIVLFIMDGIKAKSQNRKRKVGITIMFITAMVLTALQLILGIYAATVFFMFLTGKAWTT